MAFTSHSNQNILRFTAVISFTLIVLLAAPAGFNAIGPLEAMTQQAFMAQTLFRYPGLVVSMAANIFLLGLILKIQLSSDSATTQSRVGGLIVGLFSGSMSYYLSAAAFFLVAYTSKENIKEMITRKSAKALERSIPLLTGLGLALIASLTSPAAVGRLNSMTTEKTQLTFREYFNSIALDAVL